MIDVNYQTDEIKQLSDTTYKAAFISAPGKVSYHEKQKPQPQADEVVVRLIGCGVCASNIPVWEGREWFNYPLEDGTPGHEGWGVVEEIGSSVNEVAIGQHVALLNGQAFSEYAVVKEEDVVVIPSSLHDVPFPGEPLGCTMNIKRRADIQEGQTVSIIGLGFLGLSLIPLLKKSGAKVIALSRRDFSLQKALELGADEVIKMDDHYQIIEKVNQLTNDEGCERVIECTGKQWPLDLAGELAGYYGKIIIAGYHQDGVRNVNMQLWNWKALDVINAHERDPEKYKSGIRAAATAVEDNILDPEDFLTHSFSFSELADALDLVKECPEGMIKAYIKF